MLQRVLHVTTNPTMLEKLLWREKQAVAYTHDFNILAFFVTVQESFDSTAIRPDFSSGHIWHVAHRVLDVLTRGAFCFSLEGSASWLVSLWNLPAGTRRRHLSILFRPCIRRARRTAPHRPTRPLRRRLDSLARRNISPSAAGVPRRHPQIPHPLHPFPPRLHPPRRQHLPTPAPLLLRPRRQGPRPRQRRVQIDPRHAHLGPRLRQGHVRYGRAALQLLAPGGVHPEPPVHRQAQAKLHVLVFFFFLRRRLLVLGRALAAYFRESAEQIDYFSVFLSSLHLIVVRARERVAIFGGDKPKFQLGLTLFAGENG
ncbi:eukaryotic translation initiation factor 4G [Striga asiatica]|uniref:Eukaryotic translation initiation factor 4G n=1 Tax=Striga asiatica TaxID=4170 RepID=A0A5A7QIZ3_STRAF|nr:eukaryotic translation initiation factor 4G [Striga asiatica]